MKKNVDLKNYSSFKEINQICEDYSADSINTTLNSAWKTKDSEQVFGDYSKYYDLLYADKDYNAESDYIASFLGNSKKILELGCGTGKHAKILSKKGFDIFGIDLSESMLEIAQKNGINCAVGDVRTYRDNKIYDAIISLFHIVSYQNSDEDVIKYFQTAFVHLKKGGKFIFDLWYKPAVLYQKPQKRIKQLENDEIKVIRYCVPEHLVEQNIVKVNYKINIENKKTHKKRLIEETHSMRYFSDSDIKKFAEECGFKIVREEEWLTKNKPSELTWGVCFVAEKI